MTNTDHIPDEDTRFYIVAAVHSDMVVEAVHPQKGHQVSCGYTVTSAYLPDQGRWMTSLKLLPDGQTEEWTNRKKVSSLPSWLMDSLR